MLALQLLLLVGLLCLWTLVPGLFLLRRVRRHPLEKLCGAIGLSLVIVYLLGFTLYVTAAPAAVFWTASLLCLVLGVVCRGDLRRLIRRSITRRTLMGFAVLAVWTLVLLCLVRVYSGGQWSGDWLEHLQRSVFFLNRLPVNITTVGDYVLPARPPMMNLLAAFFMKHAGERFEVFHFTFAFLNLLVFFPCALLLRWMARRGGRSVVPLVALFMASPLVAQNLIYSWTKLLGAFYVLLALGLYLSAWRRADRTRMIAAFVALAAGMLVHYSVGPFIVFLGLHYLLVLWWRRSRRWIELALVLLVPAALLATWFGWSTFTYGLRATVCSNTAVTPSVVVTQTPVAKFVGNVTDTLIPFPVRMAMNDKRITDILEQESAWGWWRDVFFLLYLENLILAMGAVGGLVVLWLFLARLPAAFHTAETCARARTRFWVMLTVTCTLLGIMVHGERNYFGVTHVTLQPIVLLGLTLLAANFLSLRRRVRWLLVAGCLVDFSLGILLHFHLQNMENSYGRIVFNRTPTVKRVDSRTELTFLYYSQLSHAAYGNWLFKHEQALVAGQKRYFEKADGSDPVVRGWRVYFGKKLDTLRRQDQERWGGYYSRRRGEELTFIGDHVAVPLLWEAVLVTITGMGLIALVCQAGRGATAPGAPVCPGCVRSPVANVPHEYSPPKDLPGP